MARLVKTKAERAAEHRRIIAYIIAQEEQKEKRIMSFKPKARINVIHTESGFPIDFEYEGLTVGELKSVLAELKSQGFAPRVFQKNDKTDNTGKKGTFKSVTKVDGKDQWKFVFTVKGVGAGEQTITGFSATQFRTGDFVRFSKNDKNFMQATVITAEDFNNPATDNDIPF